MLLLANFGQKLKRFDVSNVGNALFHHFLLPCPRSNSARDMEKTIDKGFDFDDKVIELLPVVDDPANSLENGRRLVPFDICGAEVGEGIRKMLDSLKDVTIIDLTQWTFLAPATSLDILRILE